MRALIVENGAARGALAAARALHSCGWMVGTGTPTARGLTSASRVVSRRHHVPAPEAGQDAFIEAVNGAISDCGYQVVFGSGDAEALALSGWRDEIDAVVPYAAHADVVRAHDKLELARASGRAGLPTPATSEATERELARWRPPYLVKASLHAPLSDDDGPARLNAMIVDDPAVAARRATEIRAAGSVPFLQELVRGQLMAYGLVADRAGQIVAGVAQQAEATWPLDIGVSTRARTVKLDPTLREGIAALLRELGWFGLAQLQFLVPADRQPRLIDLNGRFYGSLALAVAAGPNLPAIWASLATDRTPPPSEDPLDGLRFQWMEGDLRRAVAERRGGITRDVWSCLGYSRGAVHCVWSPRDPLPSVRGIAILPRRTIKRGLQSLRPAAGVGA